MKLSLTSFVLYLLYQQVEIDGGPVVMVSAGDSHTAVVTEEGSVFAWGSFRSLSIAFNLHFVHSIFFVILTLPLYFFLLFSAWPKN